MNAQILGSASSGFESKAVLAKEVRTQKEGNEEQVVSPINEGVGGCACTPSTIPRRPWGRKAGSSTSDRGGKLEAQRLPSDLLSPTATADGAPVNWGLLCPRPALWFPSGDLGLPQFRKPFCHKDHFPGALRFRHARPDRRDREACGQGSDCLAPDEAARTARGPGWPPASPWLMGNWPLRR